MLESLAGGEISVDGALSRLGSEAA